MPHSHYVMDLYFQEASNPDRLHHEALRLVADDDDAAIAEGKRIDRWKRPQSFKIRSIRSSTRSGDLVLYTSPPVEEGGPDPVVIVPVGSAVQGEQA